MNENSMARTLAALTLLLCATPLPALAGAVQGPSSSKVNEVALFNNTTGTLIKDASAGLAQIGVPSIDLSGYGTFALTVSQSEGSAYKSPLMAFLYANAPPGQGGFPSAILGYAYLPASSAGNTALAMYGLCESYGVGWCQGAEFDVRNKTGIASDTGLPPTTNGGTLSATTGANFVCSSNNGANADCSLGVYIGNDTGAGGYAFNTGEYIQFYRQYGLLIESQPSGYQIALLAKGNGDGPLIQGNVTTSNYPSTNALMAFYDSSGTMTWQVDQRGVLGWGPYVPLSNTVGAAGGANALPSNPWYYLEIQLAGVTYKIPLYR